MTLVPDNGYKSLEFGVETICISIELSITRCLLHIFKYLRGLKVLRLLRGIRKYTKNSN